MNIDSLLGGADSYVALAQVAAASPGTVSAPESGFMTSCTSVGSVDTVVISWANPVTYAAEH